ncbi:hypothetical protein P40081_27640 [Paenibacillus sp. FSL P4-0081]|nr:hypothetical protein P40081_27640 [Paenibacillus sp. FSL P4-0081]
MLGVTGFTAINIEMSSKLSDAFPVYIGIIVILSLLILLLVFHSVIVPIKATVGFILSGYLRSDYSCLSLGMAALPAWFRYRKTAGQLHVRLTSMDAMAMISSFTATISPAASYLPQA